MTELPVLLIDHRGLRETNSPVSSHLTQTCQANCPSRPINALRGGGGENEPPPRKAPSFSHQGQACARGAAKPAGSPTAPGLKGEPGPASRSEEGH